MRAAVLLVALGCGEGGDAACRDGVLSGDETDVDCGGSCTPCADALGCRTASDCASGACTNGRCVPFGCEDGVKDGAETDVDCGGASCVPCADGSDCGEASDCENKVCTGGTCIEATCDDTIHNGTETDVDCGGQVCAPCSVGLGCDVGTDCVNGLCGAGFCIDATCYDGVHNGDETDRDCGGSCGSCTDGFGCAIALDCVSGVCADGSCAAPTCVDGVHNGDETDVDCGSGCDPCAVGSDCSVDDDCVTALCVAGQCEDPATCEDEIANGNETGVDCGGVDCPPCPCEDGVQGEEETDVDCGGASCLPCDAGLGCLVNSDCDTQVCTDLLCQVSTCDDTTQNGLETDTDCGGTDCPGCDWLASCLVDADCAAGGFCYASAGYVCTPAVTCLTWLGEDPTNPDGIYFIDPDGLGEGPSYAVYCDMTTNFGGWTLVGSTAGATLNDEASDYYDDLSTLEPTEGHTGVWDAFSTYPLGDVRFSCKSSPTDDSFLVDIAFIVTDVYTTITAGTDEDSCFAAGGDPDFHPNRIDNVGGDILSLFNEYSASFAGEDACDDVDDFTVDFDDGGMNGSELDVTDWGEQDGTAVCGDSAVDPGAWFVWFRP